MTSGDGGPPAGRERKKFAAAGLVRGETNGASAPENHGLPRHGRHAKRHTLQQPELGPVRHPAPPHFHTNDHAVYNSSLAARPAATDAGRSIHRVLGIADRTAVPVVGRAAI